MAEYKVEVTTGDQPESGTLDYIFLTLIGSKGESERTQLDNYGIDFMAGRVGTYTVKSSASLGRVLLVRLEKDPFFFATENQWFCSKIVVTTPEKDVILFPCHRWVSRGEYVELRGGKGVKIFEEEHPQLIEHRKKELAISKQLYKWAVFAPGLPHISDFKHPEDLPEEMLYSSSKKLEILVQKRTGNAETRLKGLKDSPEDWESIEDMRDTFLTKKTDISEYVSSHWEDDDFFGFQFLNANNPMVIERCNKLPTNFPVTEEMVKPSLKEGTTLAKEIEQGNIFIVDYKRMDGLPKRKYECGYLDLACGFCLLYVNPDKKLMPIAIQLYQEPSETNPIFLPTEDKLDWTLAKIFLKNPDAIEFEAVHHLLNCHFLTEGTITSTIRNFPAIHPLYKLLMPHFRYTLQINKTGLPKLMGDDGLLKKSTLDGPGVTEVLKRGFKARTYKSRFVPEDIKARGLESIPNFYYRDDALRLWDIISSYAKGMVEYIYPSDDEVRKDSELQAWIKEISTHSFLDSEEIGGPSSFETVAQLVDFITILIFTMSGQHSAVNNAQFDYNTWMPSNPLLLRKPAPTTKGKTTMKRILETLPTIGETVSFLTMGWILTYDYTDMVPLGSFPAERFDEETPKKLMKEFKEKLDVLSASITKRNSELPVAYNYLNPNQMENSIAI